MKPYILIPIIVGAALLTAGAILLPIAIVNSSSKAKEVTNEVVLDKSITNFDFDLDISDLEFKASQDGTSKLVLKESEKMYHEVKVEGETLNVVFHDRREWHERMFSGFIDYKVTAYLPAGEYGDFTLDSDTGDTLIPSGYSFENLNVKMHTGNFKSSANVKNAIKLESTTGNVRFSEISAKEIDIKSSTGNITLENVNVEEKIKLKVSTGNVNLTGTKGNDLDANASTGKITLTNTIISNHILIKASTGDVKFNDSDAETLNITTSTGDVRGTLLTSKVFYVSSDTGKINVPKSTEGGLCEIKTDTGDVNISIKA